MSSENQVVQAFEEGDCPEITLTPVESSQVKAIGYDPKTKTLACQFAHGLGSIYHYPNVEPETHAAFIGAESIGKFFGKHIKPLAFKKYPAPKPKAAQPA